MKKTIIILIFLCFKCCALTLEENTQCRDYVASLNISGAKKAKIARIENEKRKDLSKINALILLKQMEAAYLRPSKKNKNTEIEQLNFEISALEAKKQEINEQKYSETTKLIPLFKRRQYRKYCSFE